MKSFTVVLLIVLLSTSCLAETLSNVKQTDAQESLEIDPELLSSTWISLQMLMNSLNLFFFSIY